MDYRSSPRDERSDRRVRHDRDRDHYDSRSPTPQSRYTASPPPSRRRRPSSRSPPRNGSYRSDSRSLSRGPSRGRSRSPNRGRGRTESRSPLRGSTKIVVEKLSKNINEDHLHEIFGRYGPIRDLDLPMSRQFGTNRGTAYILYIHEADAEAAIAHMHEAQLDGNIINVSIVLPRRKFSPSPPVASRGANIDPRVPAPTSFRGSGRGGGGMGGGRGGRNARASPRHGRPSRENLDTYRPRSYSPSRSPPRRHRSRSRSFDSRSPSPPRRRGGRRDDYDNVHPDRRRSPSYDNYRDRDRSLSRSPRSPSRSRGYR
ncbi:RNA-binding domain-containing protein [Xylariaceae sp. FL1272]|nr:RNA-binding domain-containing protein [Xylariaceae sp. FL1272]